MAEALKRWNGTEWVTVATVNRMNVSIGEGGLLNQPTYDNPKPPPSNTSINAVSGLDVNYSYVIE